MDPLEMLGGPLIFKEVLSFIEPALLELVKPTCHSWYNIIKEMRGGNYYSCFKIASAVVKYGRPELLEYVISGYYTIKSNHEINIGKQLTDLTCIAASRGYISCIDYIFQTSSFIIHSELVCKQAAGGGQIETLKYLRDKHKFNWRYYGGVADWAALHKHFECLKFMRDNGCKMKSSTFANAAQGGSLEIIQFLHNNKCDWDNIIYLFAAENGHLEIIKYLHENGYGWDYRAIQGAARNGFLEIVKYCVENGCPLDISCCNDAARQGELDCLKYLHEKGCPWDNKTTTVAVYGNKLECLKYLHNNGCEMDSNICDIPAGNKGGIECLKFLRKIGCKWNSETSKKAAEQGNLQLLQFLHENGCPWDREAWLAAVRMNRIDCLKYLNDNGCPKAPFLPGQHRLLQQLQK